MRYVVDPSSSKSSKRRKKSKGKAKRNGKVRTTSTHPEPEPSDQEIFDAVRTRNSLPGVNKYMKTLRTIEKRAEASKDDPSVVNLKTMEVS